MEKKIVSASVLLVIKIKENSQSTYNQKMLLKDESIYY